MHRLLLFNSAHWCTWISADPFSSWLVLIICTGLNPFPPLNDSSISWGCLNIAQTLRGFSSPYSSLVQNPRSRHVPTWKGSESNPRPEFHCLCPHSLLLLAQGARGPCSHPFLAAHVSGVGTAPPGLWVQMLWPCCGDPCSSSWEESVLCWPEF